MKLKNILLIIIITSGTSLFAQVPDGNSGESIGYNEYLSILQKKLPELNRSTLTIESAENNLLGAESSSDTNLSGSGSYSRGVNYSSSTPDYKSESSTWSLNGGLSRKFNTTGTKLEAGTGYDYTTVDNSGYRSYTPSVYVKFTQSLLQNAFGVIDRFSVNDASMKLAIEKLRKSETDKSYLNYYRKLYFTWIIQREKLSLLKKSVAETKDLESEIERKVRAGLTDRLDIQTVRALLLQYELTYSEGEADLATIESEISLFLNTGTLKPADNEFPAFFEKRNRNTYSFISYEKTRSAEIYRMTRDNLSYAFDVQESRLLPQLDVTGQYTRKGNSGNDAAEAYSNMNDSEYYLGFAITYPLSNSSGRASVKEAEIAVKSINNEYEVSKKSFTINLNTAIKRIDGLKKSIEITEKRVAVLEAKYSAGYRQYLQSRQNLQFLIDTSLDITGEKIALNQLKNLLIQYSIDYDDLTEVIQK